MTLLLDCDPDPTEETTYGYCSRCQCECTVVKRDAGFGYEYGSIRGFHHDWQNACCECGEEL